MNLEADPTTIDPSDEIRALADTWFEPEKDPYGEDPVKSYLHSLTTETVR